MQIFFDDEPKGRDLCFSTEGYRGFSTDMLLYGNLEKMKKNIFIIYENGAIEMYYSQELDSKGKLKKKTTRRGS